MHISRLPQRGCCQFIPNILPFHTHDFSNFTSFASLLKSIESRRNLPAGGTGIHAARRGSKRLDVVAARWRRRNCGRRKWYRAPTTTHTSEGGSSPPAAAAAAATVAFAGKGCRWLGKVGRDWGGFFGKHLRGDVCLANHIDLNSCKRHGAWCTMAVAENDMQSPGEQFLVECYVVVRGNQICIAGGSSLCLSFSWERSPFLFQTFYPKFHLQSMSGCQLA